MNILPRLQERIHPQELIELRAKIEAKPIPVRPVSRRENWGRDMIAFLRSQDAEVEPRPLPPLTDWSARLGEAFGAVETALGWLASNTTRCIEQAAYTEYYAANGLHEACVVVKAEVGGWRREVADLAPVATLNGEVA